LRFYFEGILSSSTRYRSGNARLPTHSEGVSWTDSSVADETALKAYSI